MMTLNKVATITTGQTRGFLQMGPVKENILNTQSKRH